MLLASTVCAYLRNCNIKFSSQFITNQINSHPDYPSLLAVTDTFDQLRLEYSVVTLDDKIYYQQLVYPAMFHISRNGRQYFQIVKHKDDIQKNELEFFRYWDGTVLIIDKNSHIVNDDHNYALSAEKSTNNRKLVAVGSFLFLTLTLIELFTAGAISPGLYLLIAAAGFFICFSTILETLGIENRVGASFCGTQPGAKSSCDQVLKSPAASWFKIISISELGLLYFSVIFIFTVFESMQGTISNSFRYLGIFNGLAAVLSILSVIYQAFVIRKWCRMCLVIAGLIWLQVAVVTVNGAELRTLFNLYDFPRTMAWFVLSMGLSLPLLFAKAYLMQQQESQKIRIRELRWARDPGIFFSVLRRSRQVDCRIWNRDLFFGSRDAYVQLVIVCNAYCAPCAKVHSQVDDLLERFPEQIGVVLRFTLNAADPKDRRTAAFYNLAGIYDSELSLSKKKEAFKDWFELMDMGKWSVRWQAPMVTEPVQELAGRQQEWCEANRITKTPTIFLNGYEFPDNYKISDLRNILPLVVEPSLDLPLPV